MKVYKILLSVIICSGFLFTSCQNKSINDETEKAPADKNSFAKLNDEIAANPRRADLLFQRAQIFAQRNVLNQASIDLDKACSIDSTNTEYLMFFADVAFKSFQIKKASDCFEKVVRLEPNNSAAYLKLSELYFYIKGYQKSLAYSNEALKIDKKLVRAYYLRGFAYKEMGDTAKAISSFNTVIDLNSDDYDAFIQLGNIYAVRTHPLALQYYNSALRVQPNSTEALYNRGLYFQNKGDIQKAIGDYNTILKIDSSYTDAYFNLGFINSVMFKNYKEAISYYSKAIKIDDQYTEAFYNRGVCYESIGDKESARKDYESALKVVPTYKPAKEKLNRK